MKKILAIIILLVMIQILCIAEELDGNSILHLGFSFSGVYLGTKALDTIYNTFNIKIIDSKYNIFIISGLILSLGYIKEKYIDSDFERIDFSLDLVGVLSGIKFYNKEKRSDLKNEKDSYFCNVDLSLHNFSYERRILYGKREIPCMERFELSQPGTVLIKYLYSLSSVQ
ncbi:MAG: hypothetical protein PHV06_03450 [bacterium]|nr:hypothetical protein [bacterium]